ncbi:helix-turn-helix transcriptional regulator [Tropicibacter sp. S64]|uniref:helix-turn-helix transcriptional regulator n=1 Tax=Tropicibacter sp. S64 TaxID=3415122 RepID=UPI003C7C17B4
MTEPMMTQRNLATRWQLTIRTLERWRADGCGPAWVQIGGSIRYRTDDVLAWEEAHRTEPGGEGAGA